MLAKCFKLPAFVALLMSSTATLALPFNSFDPRSMSMGSAGVAIGDPATAPFFNPALLSAADPTLKYSFEPIIIGARLYDPSNMHTNLSTLSDNITALNNSITAANNSANGTAAVSQLPGNMNTVAANIDKVNNSLISMNNQPLQGEFGAATVLGVPGQNWGFAFYADAWGAMGGTLEYNDGTTLSNLSTSVKSAAAALNAAAGTVSAACLAVQNNNATPTQVSSCLASAQNLAGSLGTASNAVTFNTNSLTSKLHIRGVFVAESGLSFSHGFLTNDHTWSLGITPKVMQLQLFDALLSANNGTSTTGVTGNDYLTKYSTMNFDVGVAKSYNNGWRSGLVVKNVLPQSFDFKSIAPGAASGSAQYTTGTLTMNPQVRTGVSHSNYWSTVALDLDLTKNNPAGLENASQYAALGGELSASGWAQIRAGYRADLLNPGQELISLGFGLSPRIPYFKPHLDFAVTASKDILANGWNNASQVGASIKLGLNF